MSVHKWGAGTHTLPVLEIRRYGAGLPATGGCTLEFVSAAVSVMRVGALEGWEGCEVRLWIILCGLYFPFGPSRA